MPILTMDSVVICQTHAEDLRRIALKMHPGPFRISLFPSWISDNKKSKTPNFFRFLNISQDINVKLYKSLKSGLTPCFVYIWQ